MKKKMKSLRLMFCERDGFNMIELMVVVAIAGTLSTIAITSYQSFRAKSRSTEAKVALSNVLKNELVFSIENRSFSACIGAMGVTPDNSQKYYTYGFTASLANACGPNLERCDRESYPGGAPCTVLPPPGQNDLAVKATKVESPATVVQPEAALGFTNALGAGFPRVTNSTTFMAAAAGMVNSGSNNACSANTNHMCRADIWTIDQSGALKHLSRGL